MTCPPPSRPEHHPHRARVACPRCGRTWVATGRYPAWRPARWWHRITAPKPKETR
ncbi:hypothetical protein [Actinomadura decatromicini]|uniref:hypothetical protein n=1 Tax=Actinomadura decatromicini TaxID=2604572 RepID=UPI001652C110|nr:hypothetical protein [Actinomadura decatromicini]